MSADPTAIEIARAALIDADLVRHGRVSPSPYRVMEALRVLIDQYEVVVESRDSLRLAWEDAESTVAGYRREVPARTTYTGGFSNDLEALEHVFTLVGMARFNRKEAFGNGPFAGAKLGNAREYAQAAQDILSTFIARNS